MCKVCEAAAIAMTAEGALIEEQSAQCDVMASMNETSWDDRAWDREWEARRRCEAAGRLRTDAIARLEALRT